MKILSPKFLHMLVVADAPADVWGPEDFSIDEALVLERMGYVRVSLTDEVLEGGQRVYSVASTPKGKLAIRCHLALFRPHV